MTVACQPEVVALLHGQARLHVVRRLVVVRVLRVAVVELRCGEALGGERAHVARRDPGGLHSGLRADVAAVGLDDVLDVLN